MSREIKFRVWDKLSEKLIYLKGQHNAIVFHRTGDAFYINYQTGDGGKDNYILQQFTGLKDKNEKEIYEGDIVSETNSDIKGEVMFGQYFTGPERRDSHYGWHLDGAETKVGLYRGCDVALDERYMIQEYGVEIIGNIFENPDSIENGTQKITQKVETDNDRFNRGELLY